MKWLTAVLGGANLQDPYSSVSGTSSGRHSSRRFSLKHNLGVHLPQLRSSKGNRWARAALSPCNAHKALWPMLTYRRGPKGHARHKGAMSTTTMEAVSDWSSSKGKLYTGCSQLGAKGADFTGTPLTAYRSSCRDICQTAGLGRFDPRAGPLCC